MEDSSFNIASFTNDLYLAAIHKLEKAIVKKKEERRERQLKGLNVAERNGRTEILESTRKNDLNFQVLKELTASKEKEEDATTMSALETTGTDEFTSRPHKIDKPPTSTSQVIPDKGTETGQERYLENAGSEHNRSFFQEESPEEFSNSTSKEIAEISLLAQKVQEAKEVDEAISCFDKPASTLSDQLFDDGASYSCVFVPRKDEYIDQVVLSTASCPKNFSPFAGFHQEIGGHLTVSSEIPAQDNYFALSVDENQANNEAESCYLPANTDHIHKKDIIETTTWDVEGDSLADLYDARSEVNLCEREIDIDLEISEPSESDQEDMDYFKRRFQRSGATVFNPDVVLREARNRRRSSEASISVSDLKHSQQQALARSRNESVVSTVRARPASSVFTYGADSFNVSPSVKKSGDNKNRHSVIDPTIEKAVESVQSQRRTNIINMTNKIRVRSPEKKRLDQKPKDRKEEAEKSLPAITISRTKSSSLRRRRHDSDGSNRSDVNPNKKGNFSVAFRDPIKAKENDAMDEAKILDAIEIKSAAQWKIMSQRLSWKEVPDNDDIAHSPPSAKNLDGFVPTKVQQMRLICWKVKPWKQSKQRSRLFSSQFAMGWGVDCDEVYPGLFIGDKSSASNIKFLKKVGITHVLNTAEGKDEGLVDLSESHYAGTDIKYMGFPLWDTPDCNLLPYMGCAADFIGSAIENGGKCLVNCQMGVSRSSSCAMVYLMIKKNMNALDVITQFRQNRDVRPNDGFMEQLIYLDNELRKQREHNEPLEIQLSTISDLPRLPKPWNFEFWRTPVTSEDIGMPLVKLGEPCPLSCESRNSSRRSSRGLSRRSSKKSLDSKRSSTSVSRHSSFKKSISDIINSKVESGSLCSEDDYEWVWEDDEKEEEESKENVNPTTIQPSQMSSLTVEKLEKVKDIIEKPEDRWRVLWQTSRGCDSPASIASLKSLNSNDGSHISNSSRHSNLAQPGLDDPMSAVKIGSAKEWKLMSRNLTFNLEGLEVEKEALSHDEMRPDTPSEFKPTSVQQLRLLCWRIKPWDFPRARNLFSSVLAKGWGVDCDEVFPSLFIGDEASARNLRFLKKIGVTHVLNTAEGQWTDCSFVNLTETYYEGTGITYQGVKLWDSNKVRILPYFGCFNEFISSAIKGGGKCLVHCQMGVSRSCTAAMVYMMMTEGWDAYDVMTEFRKRRDVRPNDHFLAQVVELDNNLRKERLFNIPRGMKLYTLADLKKLPKPWHFEFWDSTPDPDTLPFQLCHMHEDHNSAPVNLNIDEQIKQQSISSDDNDSNNPIKMQIDLRPSSTRLKESPTKRNSSSSSDWEWEYYDDSNESEKQLQKKDISNDTLAAKKDHEQVQMPVDKEPDVIVRKSSYDLSYDCAYSVIEKKEFQPTLDKHLRLICWKVKPWRESKSNFALMWKVECDEVLPSLYIGDKASALNKKYLKHLKITHILNTAQDDGDTYEANLKQSYYDGMDICYLGLCIQDSRNFDIESVIDQAVGFIDEAVKTGGRCLVNGQTGSSRSTTCVMAYMMKNLGVKAADALTQLRTHREVRPNDGFLKYLVKLDNELRRERES